MREVEAKAHLRNKDVTVQKLRDLGCTFSEAVVQEDIVYAQNVGSLEVFLANSIFIRIRINNGEKVIFTLKYHPGRKDTVSSMPIEHEVEVSSKEELETMLALMGYEEALRIKKTRQKGTYQNWGVCLDEVEGLGSFIELEQLLEHEEEYESVLEHMKDFFLSLGIDEEDIGAKRYDIAMFEKLAEA